MNATGKGARIVLAHRGETKTSVDIESTETLLSMLKQKTVNRKYRRAIEKELSKRDVRW